MKKIIILLFTMIILLSSCSNNTNKISNSENSVPDVVSKLDEIKLKGKIVMATSADYPPYEFHKIIDGKDTIVGFDIFLAEEIAKELGVELEIKDIAFNAVLAGVATNKYDIGLAGISRQPEREEQFEFSDVYYTSEQTAITKSENVDLYKNISDFKDKVIGVQLGSLQEKIAEGLEVKDIHKLGKITDLILELKSGKIDVLLIEKPVGKSYEEKNPDLKLTDISFDTSTEEGSCVISLKGDVEFRDELNKIIKKVLESKKMDEFIAKAYELANE